jgi:hypothetical protein
MFSFEQVRVRYFWINGYGNSVSGWNSYNEVNIICSTAPVAYAFQPVADVYLEDNTRSDTGVLKVKDANRAAYLRLTCKDLKVGKAPLLLQL